MRYSLVLDRGARLNSCLKCVKIVKRFRVVRGNAESQFLPVEHLFPPRRYRATTSSSGGWIILSSLTTRLGSRCFTSRDTFVSRSWTEKMPEPWNWDEKFLSAIKNNWKLRASNISENCGPYADTLGGYFCELDAARVIFIDLETAAFDLYNCIVIKIQR